MPNPRAGTVASMVKWMVSHGKSALQIIQRVSGKFTRYDMSKLSGVVAKYSKELNKPVGISSTSNLTDAQKRQLLTTGFSNTLERVSVNLSWINPKTGLAEDTGWYVDIGIGSKGAARQEEIMNQLSARMGEFYSSEIKTQADLMRFIYSVDIVEE